MDTQLSNIIGELRAMDALDFLTPEEAATKIRVSKRFIQHLIRTGKLSGYKFGRFWRIKAWSFADFIERTGKQCHKNINVH